MEFLCCNWKAFLSPRPCETCWDALGLEHYANYDCASARKVEMQSILRRIGKYAEELQHVHSTEVLDAQQKQLTRLELLRQMK